MVLGLTLEMALSLPSESCNAKRTASEVLPSQSVQQAIWKAACPVRAHVVALMFRPWVRLLNEAKGFRKKGENSHPGKQCKDEII